MLTHLHSDHIADLGDLLITRWVSTFAAQQTPLPAIGPPGTAGVVFMTGSEILDWYTSVA